MHHRLQCGFFGCKSPPAQPLPDSFQSLLPICWRKPLLSTPIPLTERGMFPRAPITRMLRQQLFPSPLSLPAHLPLQHTTRNSGSASSSIYFSTNQLTCSCNLFKTTIFYKTQLRPNYLLITFAVASLQFMKGGMGSHQTYALLEV